MKENTQFIQMHENLGLFQDLAIKTCSAINMVTHILLWYHICDSFGKIQRREITRSNRTSIPNFLKESPY